MPEIKTTNQTNSTFTTVTSGQSTGSFTTEKGEVMMDEQRSTSIETQRLTLESTLVKELNGIIKKQNDEIDMLIKQKQYLQSKLREKTDGKKSDN